jgi:N,N'-diacetyllegionaminate synthase
LTGQVTIIAEAGVNHNGDIEQACRLIDVAADAGADFVKFQTFDPEALAAPEARKADYQIKTTGNDESQLQMLRKLALSPADHQRLIDHCSQRDIGFLSTPFDDASAEMLAGLGVAAFKISSGDLTNLPLLKFVSGFGKPMIVSTGMGDLEEVEDAVVAMRSAGANDITLLHCVTDYPADPADANLRAMATLAAAFEVPVGYSDHTEGINVSLAAVALGAAVIEKHFTLDRSLPGPDQLASLEPAELADLVTGIRTVEQALGTGRKIPSEKELQNRIAARRSLVTTQDIAAGQLLQRGDLAIMRPGSGLAPKELERVIGMRLRRAVPAGTVLVEEMLK